METLCSSEGLGEPPREAPAPFSQPAVGQSAQDHFANGHFTAAIEKTNEDIPKAVEDAEQALSLWYIRVQSLLFLQLGHQAAEESGKNLRVLESEEFRDSVLTTPEARLAAWKLRLLLVPVRTKGINQAAVQSYYSLAFEARQQAELDDPEAWLEAVELSGLYASSGLIALKDYVTAADLLKSIYKTNPQDFIPRLLAIVYTYIGDTLSAREWLSKIDAEDPENAMVKSLVAFADSEGSVSAATPDFNLGIAQVYNADLEEGISTLEKSAVSKKLHGTVMNSVLTNLFVLYDLCYPDARGCREKLVEKIAAGDQPVYLENLDMSAELQEILPKVES